MLLPGRLYVGKRLSSLEQAIIYQLNFLVDAVRSSLVLCESKNMYR